MLRQPIMGVATGYIVRKVDRIFLDTTLRVAADIGQHSSHDTSGHSCSFEQLHSKALTNRLQRAIVVEIASVDAIFCPHRCWQRNLHRLAPLRPRILGQVYWRSVLQSQSASLLDEVSPQASMLTNVRALLRRRELIYHLVVRELKARYKNSLLGVLWSLLNPLGMMVVFTIVFTIQGSGSQIARFPVYLLIGIVTWNFHNSAVMSGAGSFVLSGSLVKKVYFPREILPISTVLSNLVNFLLALIVFFPIMALFHGKLSPWLWTLPAVILTQTCFILGLAFIFSTLNVFYRDVVMVLDVGMLAWFFLSPIFYSVDSLPSVYNLFGVSLDVHRLMYILNPVASFMSMYRDILYYGGSFGLDFFLRTAFISLATLVFGYWLLTRASGSFGEQL